MKIQIEVLSGETVTRTQESEADVIKVGRGHWNDLVFSDPSQRMVSRNHAEIRVENGLPTVYDMQSSFGTFINGERVTQRALKPGDKLQFGIRGPEIRLQWAAPVSKPAVDDRTVLVSTPPPGATVVVNTSDITLPKDPGISPPKPSSPQPTVVYNAEQAGSSSVPGKPPSPDMPRPTVVVDTSKSGHRDPVKEPAGGKPEHKVTSDKGRGIGKDTMAFLIKDAVRQERQRAGGDSDAQQAQMALKTVSKMKVLLYGVGAILAIILIAVIIQNMQLQRELRQQEAEIAKAGQVSGELLTQMGRSEEEIEKARREAEEATRAKIAETEKRFQDILAQKDAEYKKEMEALKEKAKGLEAISDRIAADRKETVQVNKQLAATTEAAVVLLYCKYTLSDGETYDSHGTGFIISPDGKIATVKQVVEPWKFDEDIAAYMKVADLKIVKQDIFAWQLDEQVKTNADGSGVSAKFSTVAGSLSVLKVAKDETSDVDYVRDDTQEKIRIKLHKTESERNLAILQMKASGLPSVRIGGSTPSGGATAGAELILYGYPLGIAHEIAKPEILRVSLTQAGKILKLDKPLTRGYMGAPLSLPDGTTMGIAISENYSLPIKEILALIG